MSKITCVYCNKETPDGEWCTCEHCGHCPKCGTKTYHPVHFCGDKRPPVDKCPKCAGTGVFEINYQVERSCEACGGTGVRCSFGV